ncbi:hypothetical protein [Bacillus spizizenii]|uniref:hypothetical protein n=1 Tax=Bacillus spizizenii TaxID=96241 RepID=UPI000A52B036|nr:hypothetical protein [Bacillus spizizenii]
MRLDDIHVAVMDVAVEKLKENGAKTNKTDVIQKALHNFGDEVLSNDEMKAI